jgi:membrane associated rhomboid family serine protease
VHRGRLGAYMLLYPKARIDVFFFFGFFFKIWLIRAWVFLSIWFGLQLFNGYGAAAGGGMAYWAHIGGFIVGVALIWPVWTRLGGRYYWARVGGKLDHIAASFLRWSSIPKSVRRS